MSGKTKKIAIASGKGGTGKTTVALNLFHYFSMQENKKILLLDCDVEEPNICLFFQNRERSEPLLIKRKVPEIDTQKCTFCNACATYCNFNAITLIPKMKYARIDENLCHSCGACLEACVYDAIVENDQVIGSVMHCTDACDKDIMEGRLRVGSSMQNMLIHALKNSICSDYDIILYDAPPGTTCTLVATIHDVDYVLLVTEPTPFGLHDLSLTVELMRKMHKDFGVIINKAGMAKGEMHAWLRKEKIQIIGEIPFNIDYAGNYARGKLFEENRVFFRNEYQQIMDALVKKLQK
jgi:MinD superfamily P-loop ATPase